jgi:hypothetical protein
MKTIQVCLLIAMVLLFFAYVTFDMYAWPLSKFAENVMQSLFAIILLLIDPKSLLKGETIEKDSPVNPVPPVL